MLFNSFEFVLFFLPITLAGFFWLARLSASRDPAVVWLVGASLYFYAWWNVAYLYLILGSIVVNYGIGMRLAVGRSGALPRGWLLAAGITFNLGLLGYYKYTNFFVENLAAVTGMDLSITQILLPIGISFFTFQQIAFLVDAYRGGVRGYAFKDYMLFVSFFPQLIAGPIVHHRDVMPQFQKAETFRPSGANLSAGLTIFSFGLFKKVIIADTLAQWATPVFAAADGGQPLNLLESWVGALAYTLQIYFDFSGYCDMAIGLALMFGIRLPLNFNSPYKANSIIDFWRRWHITLSRFLRDYLYIPLGGNRLGAPRRYLNLMATMLLGGLWHGAGWNFLIWGGLHGAYLSINHAWRSLRPQGVFHPAMMRLGGWAGGILTFLAVVVAWVFFRAETFDGALLVLQGMVGVNGLVVPAALKDLVGLVPLIDSATVTFADMPHVSATHLVALPILFLAVRLLPNVNEIMGLFSNSHAAPRGRLEQGNWAAARMRWEPTPAWAAISAAALFLALLSLNHVSEFIYFQF